jgi:phosphoenolpyruvate synthase/pyruvate phosphate dikinase
MNLGNKSNCLTDLVKLGINIPKFITIPYTIIEDGMRDINALVAYVSTILKNDFNFEGQISIRSSPVHSMPGMMDTILNIPAQSENINQIIDYVFKVYNSYYGKLAVLYRKIKNIEEAPPSVILQKMVYGNKNEYSGAGIMFTHNLVGEDKMLIEYKRQSQGDSLVNNSISHDEFIDPPFHILEELEDVKNKVLNHYKYPQDLEFTVEDNVLYILQTRRLWFGNRLDYVICESLYNDGIISKKEFLEDIDIIFKDKSYQYINNDCVDPLFKGIGVVGGLVEGEIGKDILFESVLENKDIEKLQNFKGVITKEGGLTSHIAIICRNLNIPYVICKDDISGYVIMDGYTGRFYDKNTINIINLTKENVCAALADS